MGTAVTSWCGSIGGNGIASACCLSEVKTNKKAIVHYSLLFQKLTISINLPEKNNVPFQFQRLRF